MSSPDLLGNQHLGPLGLEQTLVDYDQPFCKVLPGGSLHMVPYERFPLGYCMLFFASLHSCFIASQLKTEIKRQPGLVVE